MAHCSFQQGPPPAVLAQPRQARKAAVLAVPARGQHRTGRPAFLLGSAPCSLGGFPSPVPPFSLFALRVHLRPLSPFPHFDPSVRYLPCAHRCLQCPVCLFYFYVSLKNASCCCGLHVDVICVGKGYVSEWVWPCANKTLFIKARGGPCMGRGSAEKPDRQGGCVRACLLWMDRNGHGDMDIKR